ncbi:CDGSH iron-sulfur domain-containing protein 1 [Halotydeus destructor]|nr:CDGSH iron-sulfur domain-containing protein 1 [Halotydeus destructor]
MDSREVSVFLPWVGTAVAVAYGVYVTLKLRCPKSGAINLSVLKDKPKVVDTVEIEELGDQTVYCRCWRSAKFPYCDGAHNKHNDATGDNVGPVIVKRKSAAK